MNINLLRWHRLAAIVGAVLVIWIVLTGTGIQLADMRALVTHAPPSDPDMQKMTQHHTGPANFVVRQWPDFLAAPLPDGLDIEAGLSRAATLGRAAVPDAPMTAVELRMADQIPAGYVKMGKTQLIFDLASGERLPDKYLPLPPIAGDFEAPRQTLKILHRFTFLGTWSTVFDLLAGLFLAVLTVTGLWQYWRVWTARKKTRHGELFWKGGGTWRMLHRWTSLAASVVLVWLVGTGIVLAWSNVGQLINLHIAQNSTEKLTERIDYSAPILDEEIAPLARTSLDAFHKAWPGTPMKTFRLRHFAGYAQAVIIAADPQTSQLVFNAKTGAAMTASEPGYPETFYPFGWEGNQLIKRLHRGDAAGMTGRWLITLGALSLSYLAISGIVLYVQAWLRRRRGGRSEIIWK